MKHWHVALTTVQLRTQHLLGFHLIHRVHHISHHHHQVRIMWIAILGVQKVYAEEREKDNNKLVTAKGTEGVQKGRACAVATDTGRAHEPWVGTPGRSSSFSGDVARIQRPRPRDADRWASSHTRRASHVGDDGSSRAICPSTRCDRPLRSREIAGDLGRSREVTLPNRGGRRGETEAVHQAARGGAAPRGSTGCRVTKPSP